eukprot:c28787_g2_i1 orf=474-698(-)
MSKSRLRTPVLSNRSFSDNQYSTILAKKCLNRGGKSPRSIGNHTSASRISAPLLHAITSQVFQPIRLIYKRTDN